MTPSDVSGLYISNTAWVIDGTCLIWMTIVGGILLLALIISACCILTDRGTHQRDLALKAMGDMTPPDAALRQLCAAIKTVVHNRGSVATYHKGHEVLRQLGVAIEAELDKPKGVG